MNAPAITQNAATEPFSWNRMELMEQIKATDPELLKKRSEGKLTDERSLNRFLDNPAICEFWGNTGREVLAHWTLQLGGKDRLHEEAMLRYADDLRRRLAGDNADGLEWLLAERVVMAWVFTTWSEMVYLSNLDNLHTSHHALYLKRIEMANRNLLAAAKTLAKVKRMKLPELLAIVHQRATIEA